MALDPGAITFVQTVFLEHINDAFTLITHYAFNLLFFFTVFEIVIFGLAWGFAQNTAWGSLFFKVLKIGLIFFIIQNYSWLLATIIHSFAHIAGGMIDSDNIENFIFNPGKIWQFGYDIAISLLKAAAISSSFGLVFILVVLGLGILLVLGLLGIQIVLQLVGFYLVALIALIVLPLGVFEPTSQMMDRSVQAVLKSAIRVAVLIMIIGIAVTVWNAFGAFDMTHFNLNQLLGLFFSSLLFLYLAIKLPYLAAEVVGLNIKLHYTPPSIVTTSNIAVNPPGTINDLHAVQAGTTIIPGDMRQEMVGSVREAAGVTGTRVGSITPGGGLNYGAQAALKEAASVPKSISKATFKKFKKSLMATMREFEKNKKNA